MKTRINLYLPEFKPPKELLSVARVVMIALAVLAVMILWVLYARNQVAVQQKKNMELVTRLNNATEELTTFQRAVSERSSGEQLEAELERAKIRYESKRQLADVLSQMKSNTEQHYSSLLLELARISTPNIAIESVSANGRVVTIKGKTADPAAVAEFVESFKRLDYLHNLSFASVNVGTESGKQSGLLQFSLVGFDPSGTGGKKDGGSK
jgi:Tfp pilus assembly protein PilN